jgi:hypothetical protein
MVLFLGAILLVSGLAIFNLAVNNSSETVGNRNRVAASLSAESALAHLRNVEGQNLLGYDDHGGPLPKDSGPYGLYRQSDQYFLAYPKLDYDGKFLGLHSLVAEESLPEDYEATTLKDRTPDQRWWVHQLGAVRWLPLNMADLAISGGIVPVAVRQVEVVGESGSGRSAVTQTLQLAIDLTDQATSRRPEVAMAAVGVTRVIPDQQAAFTIKGSTDQPSRIRFEGPVLIDVPKVEKEWVRLDGKMQISSVEAAKSDGDIQPLNPALLTQATDREKSFLLNGGESKVERPGDIQLDTRFSNVEPEDVPGTMQLTQALAEFIGKAGTSLRKEFNPAHNVLNPAGEKIYDAKKGRFDFSKTRRGIFYLPNRTLTLRGEPFRLFTYKGQGVLVITARDTCLTLENASLVPVSNTDSLTIICAVKPGIPGQPRTPGATSTPGTGSISSPSTDSISAPRDTSQPVSTGVTTTVNTTVNSTATPQAQQVLTTPAAIRVTFSTAIPGTILADKRGVPYLLKDKQVEIDVGAPPGLPTTLKRLISGVTFDTISIPSGARAVALDGRNYVLARVSERGDEAQVLISLGVNSGTQRGSLQLEGVQDASVVPLIRLQAHVYANGPFVSEGSVRIVGSLIASSIAITPGGGAPNTQSLLYSDPKYGSRYLFDAIYRRIPENIGEWLITFRPRRFSQPPKPVAVQRIDGLLWQRSDFERWRTPPPEPPQEAANGT